MAIELVFESHSTTVDNELGRATGWLPASCRVRDGYRAPEFLGNRRREDGIAAVLSSDLHRAVETVSIAFRRWDSSGAL